MKLPLNDLDRAIAALRMIDDIRALIDEDIPGRSIAIGRHDGEWTVQQWQIHLEEAYPTDIAGAGDTLPAAIADARRRAEEG